MNGMCSLVWTCHQVAAKKLSQPLSFADKLALLWFIVDGVTHLFIEVGGWVGAAAIALCRA